MTCVLSHDCGRSPLRLWTPVLEGWMCTRVGCVPLCNLGATAPSRWAPSGSVLECPPSSTTPLLRMLPLGGSKELAQTPGLLAQQSQAQPHAPNTSCLDGHCPRGAPQVGLHFLGLPTFDVYLQGRLVLCSSEDPLLPPHLHQLRQPPGPHPAAPRVKGPS